MASFKEIVTKAVIGKAKKTSVSKFSVTPNEIPDTVLGCWVINHTFEGHGQNGAVVINGVITEEGSVHYEDSVKVYMKEEHLFPMLQRVNLFIQAMTVQGMEKYFDRVSSPILNSEAE